MATAQLSACPRTTSGKGAARKLRAPGRSRPSSTATPASRSRCRSPRVSSRSSSRASPPESTVVELTLGGATPDADPRDPAPPVQEADPPRRLPGAGRRREGLGRHPARVRRHSRGRAPHGRLLEQIMHSFDPRRPGEHPEPHRRRRHEPRDRPLAARARPEAPRGHRGADDEDATVALVSRRRPWSRRRRAERSVVPPPSRSSSARRRKRARKKASEVIARCLLAEEPVKVILGLGNPGKEYEHTRHNVGWWLIDHLADVWRFDGWRKDGETLTRAARRRRRPVRLVKPQTYMNLSGRCSAVSAPAVLVGGDGSASCSSTRWRSRSGRSAFAREGARAGTTASSRRAALGTQQYPRLRIGVEPDGSAARWRPGGLRVVAVRQARTRRVFASCCPA